MILYRISRCNYAGDTSGTGARLYGGRWNSVGKAMLYLASSRALAVLEVLVHLSPTNIPNNFCVAEFEVPDTSIYQPDMRILPDNWSDISAPAELKKIGDAFLEEQIYFAMKVPSAIVSDEYNYLVNPLHPAINKIQLISKKPFSFDERLLNVH